MANLGPELEDFADTAAVISQLDLVICVDTAVAHLAGALGKPVWLMLQKDPDWRWMLEREDSPWYPTMRLFRQRGYGDWSEVIERVKVALEQRKVVLSGILPGCGSSLKWASASGANLTRPSWSRWTWSAATTRPSAGRSKARGQFLMVG